MQLPIINRFKIIEHPTTGSIMVVPTDGTKLALRMKDQRLYMLHLHDNNYNGYPDYELNSAELLLSLVELGEMLQFYKDGFLDYKNVSEFLLFLEAWAEAPERN